MDKPATSTPASESITPVFLVGCERSGTTLLRLMLDHHPRVCWCNEFEYVVDAMHGGEPPTIADYQQYLATHRVFNRTGFTLRTDLDYAAACNDFLEQRKQKNPGKPFVGATCHRHFDRLLKLWPEARFIYLGRDGRDVARSCIGMGWNGNVWTASKRWVESVEDWEALRSKLPSPRYIETSYEKLIMDPRGELTRLLNFIGPGFHEDVWQYQDGTTYGEPDPQLIAQWKRKLSPKELGLVEGRIGPYLQRQGYELSGHPPITVTPAMERKLRLQDRWFRMTYRWRRFGVLLSVGESITKRTGPKPLHTKIIKKIHAIQNQTKR